jgi:DNA-binding GntR family transcriptional regulator
MAEDLSSEVANEYRTLQDIVTGHLRTAILDGRLGPGDRLQHDDLARQFGVSRMPVREALGVLQSEGLVELRPHRGAVVVDLRPDDVAEIFEIRAMLEARAAELAAPNLSDETLAQMGEILDEMGRIGERHAAAHAALHAANGSGEPARHDGLNDGRWLTLNSQFHTIVYPASGWPHLCSLIEAQRNVVQPYLRLAAAYLGRTETAHAEHVAILEAAKARDSARLAALTVTHMRRTASELVEYLSNLRSGATGNGITIRAT